VETEAVPVFASGEVDAAGGGGAAAAAAAAAASLAQLRAVEALVADLSSLGAELELEFSLTVRVPICVVAILERRASLGGAAGGCRAGMGALRGVDGAEPPAG